METKRSKKPAWLKPLLIFAAMAFFAFLPETAFSSNPIAGEWEGEWIFNDNTISENLKLKDDGSAHLVRHINDKLVVDMDFNWAQTGEGICYFFPNGSQSCGFASMAGPRQLTISISGKILRYNRPARDSIAFGAYTHWKCSIRNCWCREYKAKGWTNSDCNCGHKKSDHYEFQ